MFYLLRPEETLKMAVKLESVHPARTRYLVVVSRMTNRGEESCLLGIDCNEKTTVGLVLRVLADTKITLDGDGGFSVSICDSHHIFKPVSVQAMWSALQTLHRVSAKAREGNYYQGGGTHSWVEHYEEGVTSERSCLNEWHAMDCLESRRPPSPDSVRARPTEREETEKVIRSTLKEIMMSVDLDEVTSKFIRSRLEEELDMDLGEYKSFIDQEMLVILGQMDAPTEIFDHVYLGSEWNASNYEELQRNGVRHILNVTREIDNFFPGTFDYLNVRVYDDEKTDLLKHWDDTFKYITKARNEGSKVLVHCKMGVSRSASVVIAYAMKAYNWDFNKALHHVKEKRSCIKPNTNFLTQLETYQGILDAMKNKEKLQRSKSETNLKSPTNGTKVEKAVMAGGEPTPVVVQVLSKSYDLQSTLSGQDLRQMGTRPKSWSPDNLTTREIKEGIKSSPGFMSLEDLSQRSASKESVQESKASLARHVLMPCDNGESYSVSPNKIIHLPGHDPTKEPDVTMGTTENSSCNNKLSSSKTVVTAEQWDPGEVKTILGKSEEVEEDGAKSCSSVICDQNDKVISVGEANMWTSSAVIVTQCATVVVGNNSVFKVPESHRGTNDPFSNQVDKVFDKEEKKQQRRDCPSRQSSWSSYDSAVVMEKNELSRHSSWGSGDTRIAPSRNSSWGSYDMRPRGPVYYHNEKGEKILHSASDLEQNPSGIFPYDKEDIPWHPGTVRRTKQKLESQTSTAPAASTPVTRQLSNESATSSCLSLNKSPSTDNLVFNFAEAVNEGLLERARTTSVDLRDTSSAITQKIDIPKKLRSAKSVTRLSTSAPERSSIELVVCDALSRSESNVSSTIEGQVEDVVGGADQRTNNNNNNSVKRQRSFLESRLKDSPPPTKKLEESLDSTLGKVQNLKKEFEAKSSTTRLVEQQNNTPIEDNNTLKAPTIKNRVSSLPSSPVCVHHQNVKESSSSPQDELNVKSLRNVFENTKEEQEVKKRQNPIRARNGGATRHSCVEVSNPRILPFASLTKPEKKEEFKRPPIGPAATIAATVIATAAKKQQQYGKTHPLSRLTVRPRHNNPVYNTM
ncbi:protein phosphatase Slingshot isoform X2 [Anthonomus grandis grandis]|nr:protein phosphatase Slingshot isoform X2 [Anthonomus grandis grandis]